MHIFSSYFVNVAAQAVGRVCSFGANLAVFIVVARMGGAEVFGRYSYVLAFLSVLTIIADFSMTSVLGRDIAQADDRAPRYWGNFLMLRGAAAALAMGAGLAAAWWVRPDLYSCLCVGVVSLPFLASRFFDPVYQVYERPWYTALPSCVYGVSYLLLSLAAFALSGSLLLLICMYVAANVLYAVSAYGLARKVLRPVFIWDPGIIKQILRLALPLGVSSLFTIISSRAAVFLLADLSNDTAVAIFNAAFRFFELAAMLAVMLAVPLLPIFSRQVKENAAALKDNFMRILELMAVILIPAALVTPLLSAWFMPLLFGPQFAGSAAVLNILAWVSVLAFYSMIASNMAIALGVVHFSYWLTGAVALLSIGSNYLLIPLAGPPGSAWAALVCEAVLSGVTVLYIVRTIGNVFKPGTWLRIAASCGLLCLVLYLPLPNTGPGLRISAGLVLYVLVCLTLHPHYRQGAVSALRWFSARYEDTEHYPFTSKQIRRLRYLFSFLYRPQLMLMFPLRPAQGSGPDSLPKGYRFAAAAPGDFGAWAELVNSDGGLGEWSPERIKSEILPQLIAPDAALLVFDGQEPVGSICCFDWSHERPGAGMLMWFIVHKQHRKQGLASFLWGQALECFARRGFTRVYLQTDAFRYPALQFYFSKTGRPVYDSLSSLVKWRSVRKRIGELQQSAAGAPSTGAGAGKETE